MVAPCSSPFPLAARVGTVVAFTLASSSWSGCAQDPNSVGNFTGTSSGLDSGFESGSSADDEASTSTTASSDTGDKLDLMAETGSATGGDGSADEGCTFVDIVFVIDNSGSMGGYQNALGMAFPQFASTLAAALPPGTNVHVGVTSSEMGYSSQGNTSISNGECTFIGDNNQSHEAFYITPDVMDTGRNGAQGRLFDPGGGQHYFEFETDQDLSGVQQWFAGAAAIGTGGSNIEMSAAPVAWIADPANDATNAGFIRDEGAVLVVFFMQDEPDQSPWTIEGQAGGAYVLDRITAAKSGCGGADCIVAGGFLNANACSANGNLPLDDLLIGLGGVDNVAPLPPDNNAAQAAAQMNLLLSDTLADVIASKCDEIPPID